MKKLKQIKTQPTASSVEEFITTIPNDERRKDSLVLVKLLEKVSKEAPKMWGTSIIGFGETRYKSPATGREVDWFKIGFSPRTANLSVYFCAGLQPHAAALKTLGKHKTGVGCLYVKNLADIDIKVLEKMIRDAVNRKTSGS